MDYFNSRQKIKRQEEQEEPSEKAPQDDGYGDSFG
jgi:hypothetical protein